jgi:hypothetical protein
MDTGYEDGFVVYLRLDPAHGGSPDDLEQPIADCRSYAEALRVGRACLRKSQDSVIRYYGDLGGSG